jgi:tetratricopeptide (TPR) repeat protein
MKIKFLITGLILTSASVVFAQKGTLTDAADAFAKYDALRQQPKLSLPNLAIAKAAIDKAAANDKTASLPQTYAVKGAIYASLAYNDTIPSTSTPLFITADEALKKAKETDTKGENKKLIESAYTTLAQIKYNRGIKDFNSKNFSAAYESFNYFRTLRPDDTSGIYATGLSAVNAKKYPEAIANYNTLLSNAVYKNKLALYNDLTSIYLLNKDTANALKNINEALAKYPTNASLRNTEIQLYIQRGKLREVNSKLEDAITADPKNKVLYYYSGYTYLQDKNYDKAIEKLSKSLEIDPSYFDANLSLGYVYLNQGIDLYNKANKMAPTKANQKVYDDMSAKAVIFFDKAKPFLVKATEINPKSTDALGALKNMYVGKKDMVNANITQKKLDALK